MEMEMERRKKGQMEKGRERMEVKGDLHMFEEVISIKFSKHKH